MCNIIQPSKGKYEINEVDFDFDISSIVNETDLELFKDIS